VKSARPVTEDSGRGIRFYQWAHTGQHIVYYQDADGDENWRVYSVDHTTGQAQALTPFANTEARILKTSRRFPEEIVVELNDRDPKWHDVYRISVIRGHTQNINITGLASTNPEN
jgi:Tol biopolymer transport system component